LTHLRDIDVPNIQLEYVTILIGIDVAVAYDQVTLIEPSAETPGSITFKTTFGWCLGGPRGPQRTDITFIAKIVTEERSEDLNELMKRFCQLKEKDVNGEQPVLSEDDLRGKRLLHRTVKKVCNR
jgi:hypothetical protein